MAQAARDLNSRDGNWSSGFAGDAANDNPSTHALWRRAVAAGIAALFALSLILIGLVCASADEPYADFPFQKSNEEPS